MTRISEAVECLEALGYTVMSPNCRETVTADREDLAKKRDELFELAWDYLDRAETAEAKLDRISAMACDDDAGAWNAHQPLIVAITATTSAVQS